MEALTEQVAQDQLYAGNKEASTDYLSFELSGETFAIETGCIKEIIEYGSVTRVPISSPVMRGVINLRGRVVPVIDLAVRLGKNSFIDVRRPCIILVTIPYDDEPMDIGITIDSVNEVMALYEHHIETVPAFGTSINPKYLSGMGRQRDTFISLLKIGEVLNISELMELDV